MYRDLNLKLTPCLWKTAACEKSIDIKQIQFLPSKTKASWNKSQSHPKWWIFITYGYEEFIYLFLMIRLIKVQGVHGFMGLCNIMYFLMTYCSFVIFYSVIIIMYCMNLLVSKLFMSKLVEIASYKFWHFPWQIKQPIMVLSYAQNKHGFDVNRSIGPGYEGRMDIIMGTAYHKQD